MEKESGFWFRQQHLHPLTPNPNLLGYSFHAGGLNSQHVHRNQNIIDATLEAVPFCPVPQMKSWKTNEQNVSVNWFHSFPHSLKPCTPVLAKENLTGATIGTRPSQRMFLVFDKSGDKTTLIYNSGAEFAGQRGTHCFAEPLTTHDLNKKGSPDSVYNFRPIIDDDEHGEENCEKDEMREDTEELNALLYSGSGSYVSEDDEEMSTGHSPSTMTDHGITDSDEETGEEVVSSFEPIKRRKLESGSFARNRVLFDFEDDAVSHTGTSCNEKVMENGSLTSGEKRTRKERINETASILQRVIPNASDKDAIVVIDEAISYLKSLKAKAMALGLDAL